MPTSQDKQRDHFVAQMYLRRFVPEGRQNLLVYNRRDDEWITPNTDHICCERGWDVIENNLDKDILKKILREVEPHFSNSVNRMISRQFYVDDKVIISWYLGILFLLNPQHLQNMKELYESIIKTSTDVLIDNGVIDIPSEIEKALKDKHKFEAKVNPMYIKNCMLRLMCGFVVSVYKLPWVIMNNNSDVDFLTSDNPITFMPCPNNCPYKPKYLPLDAKHILFLPPILEMEELTLKPQKFDFNAKSVGNVAFIDLEPGEEKLFNLYTIANAGRFVIIGREDKRLIHFAKKIGI